MQIKYIEVYVDLVYKKAFLFLLDEEIMHH